MDKQLIAVLATGEYIEKGTSVLMTGVTVCGKSLMASALGHQACMQRYTVSYFNTQKLMLKLKMSRLEGSIYKLFEKLSKTNLLIMDDFGLTRLDEQQQMGLMELIEDCHARRATIIANQLPLASWYDVIGK